jgi:hypothetical protein
MRGRFFQRIRDLHLYLGLFISPFVLVFAISVFFLVHAWLPKFAPVISSTRVVPDLPLPGNLLSLSGRSLIDALKPTFEKANVHGDAGFVRHLVREKELIIPLTIPGRETTVRISIARREAAITTRETGLADALVTLHKFPGPHTPNFRMNWFYMKAWRWMADTTVYLVLFISISGVYLWYMLRAERRVGFILLFLGALTFFGLAYAVSH